MIKGINEKEKVPKNFKLKKCIEINSHINLPYDVLNAIIDDTFTIFKSIKNEQLLIYSSTEDYTIYSLYCYSLKNEQNITKIAKAHNNRIYSCRHFLDKKLNSDLLITGSFDKFIKIWNITNQYLLLYTIKPDYEYKLNTYLLSENMLFYNNKNYLIVSAYEMDSEGYEILFYDLEIYNNTDKNLEKFKSLKNSKDNTNYLGVYYNNDNPYILAGNFGNIKVFNFSENKLFNTYTDNFKKINYLSIIIKDNKNGIKALISSGADGILRIWNFNNSNLIARISSNSDRWLVGLCLFNEKYIFATSKDETIKIFDLISNKFVDSFYNNNEKLENNAHNNFNNYLNIGLLSAKKFEMNQKIYIIIHSYNGLIELFEYEN